MEESTAAAAQMFAVQAMARAAALGGELSAGATSTGRTLGEREQQTLARIKGLGQQLLAGVCAIVAAGEPAREQPCGCGATARYVRHRAARVLTVLGAGSIVRADYHCPQCRRGAAPLDRQRGYCAGSTSAGLEEVLALLGATADSFAEAVALLDKLTLVRGCPNLARAATERLGQAGQAAEQQAVAAAWGPGTLPTPVAAPPRRYGSLDGVLVQTDAGWREDKLGTVYTTVSRPARHHPGRDEVQAQDCSFVGEVTAAANFGHLLWCAAARRGVLTATAVLVVAEGAHWSGNLAAEHFPGATEIVDWDHASQYIWAVAHASYGAGAPLARRWAKRRLAALWEGPVDQVLTAFAAHQQRGQVVAEAATYFTNHRQRMRYAAYRARGLQIGSGTIERGCKQVSTARLKLAGMRWSLPGARAVAAVRTRLTRDRWPEVMALRPPRHRAYHRQAAYPCQLLRAPRRARGGAVQFIVFVVRT